MFCRVGEGFSCFSLSRYEVNILLYLELEYVWLPEYVWDPSEILIKLQPSNFSEWRTIVFKSFVDERVGFFDLGIARQVFSEENRELFNEDHEKIESSVSCKSL